MMVDEGIYNSLIHEQKQWQQTSIALDQSRLKIYELEQDMTKLKDEKDKLQKAHSVAWEVYYMYMNIHVLKQSERSRSGPMEVYYMYM